MAELSVKIGADVSELNGKLSQAQASLKQFEKEIEKTQSKLQQLTVDSGKVGIEIEKLGNDFKQGVISQSQYEKKLVRLTRYQDLYSKEIKETKAALTQLNSSYKTLGGATNKLGGSVGKLNKTTANAVPTLTSFSQVIQDAPYGIRGVANNITQLTSQFGYLSKSAGGSGAALKTMLGSLVGPAGILFAVSAVTSLLVSYGDKLTFSTSATNGLAKATAKFVGDAKLEITTLNTLLAIAKDENATKIERQGALDELNKNYSKYLGNLDLESIKTDTVTTSVENLTKALILKAKVQGLESLITEKTTDALGDITDAELKRKQSIKGLTQEINKAIKGNSFLNTVLGNTKDPNAQLKALQDLAKRNDDVGESAKRALVNINPWIKQFNDASKSVKGLNKELDDSLAELVGLQEEFKKDIFTAEANINQQVDTTVIITGEVKDIEVDPKAQEKINKLLSGLETDLISFDAELKDEKFLKDVDAIVESTGAKYGVELDLKGGNEAEKQIRLLEDSLSDVQKTISSFGLDPAQFDLSKLDLSQLDVLKEKLESVQVTSDLFANAVSSAFSTLASEMAENINTGNEVLDAFISSLISGLTSLLSQILTQQIAQSAAQSAIGTTAAAAQAATAAAQVTAATTQAVASGLVAKAQGVQIATTAAAAFGPLGLGLLPGFLTAVEGQIAAALAFAKIPAFATGGFTGDNHLIRVNGNEAVLTAAEVFSFRNQIGNHQLNNNFRPMENNVELSGEVILRGSTQVIQLRRAEKKMSRFYNS